MSVKARKFLKGIRLKSTTEAPTLDGEISNKDNKLQAHLEGDVRVVVTEDQTQTLTNKTIDATAATGTNSLSADSVDIVYDNNVETVISLENAEDPAAPVVNVQEAIDSIKRALDAQNEASEIKYDNTNSGLTATDVQAAIDEVDGILDNHLADTTAHGLDKNISGNVIVGTKQNQSLENKTIDADNNTISNIETDNLKSGVLVTDITAASDHTQLLSALAVKEAIEAQDEASEIEFNKTDDIPSENVQGAIEDVQANLKAHDDSSSGVHGLTPSIGNVVVGTTEEQDLENKTYIDAYFSGMISEGIIDRGNEAGQDCLVPESSEPILKLTNNTLQSIRGIVNPLISFSKVLTIINATGNDVEIRNNFQYLDEEIYSILTGTDDDITLAQDAALLLKYDIFTERWRVIGGTGGASTVVKGTAGENLAANQFAAIGADGNIYKLNASDDNRIEYIGAVKSAASSSQPVKVISSGIIKGFTGLTTGLPVYANPLTIGGYTQIDPENNIFDNKWVIRLGIAISETQILLNPDQAGSAYFKSEVQADVPILNNQSTAQNLTNLAFNGAEQNRVTLEYGIFRRTDTISLAQAGELKLVYNEEDMEWFLSDSYAGQNAGVTFSISNAGQLQYTSTNLTGANYQGRLEYRIAISTGLAETSLLVDDGDLITKENGVSVRLPIGTSGQVLISNGTTASWQNPLSSQVTTIPLTNNQSTPQNTSVLISETNGAIIDYSVTRLRVADGVLNTSFTANSSDSNQINDRVLSSAIQSDGKVLLGGEFFDYFRRLNSNGTMDTAFNTNASGGKFVGLIKAIKVQSDGKILVGGNFEDYNSVSGRNHLIRLNSDGTLDTSFTTNSSDGGKINFSGVYSIATQSDGKILVAGDFEDYNSVSGRNHLIRLNSDGTLDTAFVNNATDGSSFPTGTPLRSVLVLSSGKILVGGSFATYKGVSNRRCLVALNSDGTLDTAFMANAVTDKFNLSGLGVLSMAQLPDGRIVVAGGFANYDAANQNRLVILNEDGTLDTTSTNNASASSKFNAGVYSVAVTSNNKIVVGGVFTGYGGSNRNRFVRLNSDGTADSNFISNATFSNKFSSDVETVAVFPNGGSLAGGNFVNYAGTSNRNRLVVFNPDGHVIDSLTAVGRLNKVPLSSTLTAPYAETGTSGVTWSVSSGTLRWTTTNQGCTGATCYNGTYEAKIATQEL